MDVDLFAKISKQKEVNDFYSSVLQDIDEVQTQNPISIHQNINYYYTHNDRNIFAVEAQHLYQDEDPFYNAIIAQNPRFGIQNILSLNKNQTLFDLEQKKRVKTHKTDLKGDYWRVINNQSNLNITAGLVTGKQHFNSDIFQILDDNNIFTPSDSEKQFQNDINYTFNDAYLGVRYTLKTGIFTFRPGLSVHNYQLQNTQFNSTTKDNFVRLLPDFNTRIQFKKSENLIFNYAINNTFTNVNQLAEAFVLNNYNNLFQGNRELKNSLSHNFRLNFFSFNLFNYTNIFARINYSKRINQIRNQTVPLANSTNRVSKPFNSNFEDETFNFNGRFEKTIKKIKGSLGTSFVYSKFNQLINQNQTSNKSFTQNYNAKFNTNFDEFPNFEFGYAFKINQYNQGGENTSFFTHSPFFNVDAVFLKAFTFSSSFTYSDYKNEEKSLNTYSFWDASLAYQKKDSKWEYKLLASNLLNNISLNRDNANNLFTSTTEYFVQPRYITLQIKYEL